MHNWKIQYDQVGSFRIIKEMPAGCGTTQEVASAWAPYRSMAVLEDEGNTYIAVTAYYAGMIPHSQVIYINPQPTTLQEVERVLDEHKQERVIPYGIEGAL